MVYFECCNILSCSVYFLHTAMSLLSRRIIGSLYQDIVIRLQHFFFAASLYCTIFYLQRGTNGIFWALQYSFLLRGFLAHSYVLIGALHQDIASCKIASRFFLQRVFIAQRRPLARGGCRPMGPADQTRWKYYLINRCQARCESYLSSQVRVIFDRYLSNQVKS